MLSNKAVFNLVDFDDSVLVVGADAIDLQLKVELLGSKSFANPERHQVVPPTIAGGETFGVTKFTTRNKPIDDTMPAFQGGYGAVRISSLDGNVFVAFASVRSIAAVEQFVDRHPMSGPTCGSAFRIPLLAT